MKVIEILKEIIQKLAEVLGIILEGFGDGLCWCGSALKNFGTDDPEPPPVADPSTDDPEPPPSTLKGTDDPEPPPTGG